VVVKSESSMQKKTNNLYLLRFKSQEE